MAMQSMALLKVSGHAVRMNLTKMLICSRMCVTRFCLVVAWAGDNIQLRSTRATEKGELNARMAAF